MTQALVVLVAASTALGALYVLWRPHWAFILVAALYPLEQLLQSYIPFLAAHTVVINYAIGFLALVALMMRTFRREQVTSGLANGVTVTVLLLYLQLIVGMLLYPAVPELSKKNFLHNYPIWILLLGIFPLLVRDLADFRRLVTGLMVIGSLIAILVMLNPHTAYISGRLHLDLGYQFAGNALATAELGAMAALVAALIRPTGALLYNILRVTTFLSGFGLAILTGSRGQVLAGALSGVLVYPIARKVANPKQFLVNCAGFAILLLGIYVSFKLFVGDVNRERWDVHGLLLAMVGRYEMAWTLFSAWLESPEHWLFGLGPTAYMSLTGHLYVHNVPVEILCEHGLVGASFFGIMSFFMARHALALWKIHQDDPPMRAAVGVLVGICLYSLLLSLKQGSFIHPVPFCWWLVLAKISKHEQMVHAENPLEQEHESEDGQLEPIPDSDDQDNRYALGYSS
ncbi:MAG: hypothetical protein L0Y44_04200 [Phycisphaerales bacterium]|nr:hypothetical protein [Phycisphaerales bacterium]MCI0629840.1 hypothetical protein [Phycisphaerales bacterium]